MQASDEAADRLGELPERLGLRRVAEVEAVRDAERPGAGDRDVPRRLDDRQRGPEPRVDRADGGVGVGRGDERLGRALDPQDRRAAPGSGDRVRLHVVVVLLEDRAARREVRRAEQRQQHGARVLAAQRERVDGLDGRAGRRARARRRVGGPRLALEHDRTRRERGRRDPRELARAGDRPASASRAPVPPGPVRMTMSGSSVTRPITATGRSQRRHTASTAGHRAGSTIATMRSCDSEIITSNGSSPGSRRGIASRSTSIPVPPRSAVSRRGAGDPGRPEVLDADDEALRDQLERRLDQQLLRERVADLDRRPLGRVLVAERRAREHGRPADPVAPGRRAVQHDEVPDPVGRRPGQHPVLEQPDRHHVDERVALVRGVEHELAAHRRHADAVAVPADAAHDPVDEVSRPRVGRVAEPEGVEDRDRSRAHREHVAQDPADAGRRALVGLDGGRVVVGLDLERDREPVADRDHAGLLPHPGDDVAAGGREGREERPRALVRAVLAPHDAEHRELEVVGVAAQLLADRLELDVLEPERPVQRGGGRRRHAGDARDSSAAPDAARHP